MHRAQGKEMDLRSAASNAARDDDLPCFIYAHENGAFSASCRKKTTLPRAFSASRRKKTTLPRECPMAVAAAHSEVSILEYGLRHKDAFPFDWRSLVRALVRGNVQVVDIVLRGGCPRLDAAIPIAAAYGHLACVRYLHARGFPLWDHADAIPGFRHGYTPGFGHGLIPDFVPDFGGGFNPSGISDLVMWLEVGPPIVYESFLNRSHYPGEIKSVWGVMRYGELHGAPVTQPGKRVCREKRERAREVLMCFHTAAQSSRGGGEHARLLGAMARVPERVVHKILVAARLEIEEAFKPAIERRERAREVLLCFHSATRLSRGGGEHAPLWGIMGAVPADVVQIILIAAQLKIEKAVKPRLPPSNN